MTDTQVKIMEELRKEYFEQDLCMYDFLASAEVPSGVSFESAMEIYAMLMNAVENDEFYRVNTEDGFKYDIVNEKFEKI